LQYTIEVRELTNPTSYDAQSLRTVVMAKDADEAIQQYVRDRAAELMSFMHPGNGQESIATVKKEDAFFLVRVYEA
jgi:predicted oxidoreductase (fatty acid repression mutant protein)